MNGSKWRWVGLLSMGIACGEVEPLVEAESSQTIQSPVTSIERKVQQGPIDVMVTVSPEVVRLGDPIRLLLKVEGTEGVEIEMPPFGEALGRLTIVDFTPKQGLEVRDGQSIQVHTQAYGLQPNRSGEVVIPALRVGYRETSVEDWGEVLTEPISIEVTSILPTDGDLVYQATRTRLAELPVDRPWLPWALGALGMVAMGSGFFWRRRKQILDSRLSAYDEAMQRLGRLQDTVVSLQEGDSVDDLYVELSSVLRGYLEGTLGISALEQTTEELRVSFTQSLVAKRSWISTEREQWILAFLLLCDGVKFAGRVRTLSEVQTDWTWVRECIQSIQMCIRKSAEGSNVESYVEQEGKDGLV